MSSKGRTSHSLEREVFLRALDYPDAAERREVVERSCAGDAALLSAVESLLASHKDDGFLETPLVSAVGKREFEAVHASGAVTEKEGDWVGHYRLLQQIGEGAVGIVFMAEQQRPISRRVAIKVVKPGMDTKSVIARFESERQALALMDHPNIAKVFEAGSTPQGRPYFVMELVRGIRITDYCDRNQLSTRERLQLFIQVCQAIQHAHQKGVIHRDIKPSNVMVTSQDGQAVPKVIDFGIAKAFEHRLTDRTLFTRFESFVGTPAYISPEQAEMSSLDIDTRADIYSLGVVLYELLTGRTPFDAKELVTAGLDSMRRTIREREPKAPSTLVSTMLAGERTVTAERRQVEDTRLVHVLKGDLDWIVLKALEKDRTRRYETASGLAQDVQRYLENEPVMARPPSAVYRFRKFLRRNRLACASAGAVGVAVVAGMGLFAWQFVERTKAVHRLQQAEEEQGWPWYEAEQARQLAEIEAQSAQRQAYNADVNLAQQALQANNLGRVESLLDRHRPGLVTLEGEARYGGDLRGWEWRYLWDRSRSDALFTLCQEAGSVNRLSVSADGRWVAVGAERLVLWDLRARSEVLQFPDADARGPFTFSPTERLIAFVARGLASPAGSGGDNSHVALWDAESKRVFRELPLSGRCLGLAFSADGKRLLVLGGREEIHLWDVATGELLSSVHMAPEPFGGGLPPFLGSAAISDDLRRVALAVGGGRLRVLDVATGRTMWEAAAADEMVTSLAFSPDGRTLASAGGFVESSVRLWDVSGGKELGRMEGHRTYVRSLLFWPDGRTLASGSGDQTIHLWDMAWVDVMLRRGESGAEEGVHTDSDQGTVPPAFVERSPKATLRGHRLEVWSMALCPDGTTLASGGKDGVVNVWDVSQVEAQRHYRTLPVAAAQWGFSGSGEGLVVLERGGRVSRWQGPDYASGQTLVDVGDIKPMDASFSPDGRCMAALDPERGSLMIWDFTEGERLDVRVDDWERPVRFLAPSNTLLTASDAGRVFRVRDPLSGEVLRTWEHQESGGRFLPLFSGAGEWYLTLGQGGVGRLYSGFGGEEGLLLASEHVMQGGAFSNDGRWLAVLNDAGGCEVWDVMEGRRAGTVQGFLQGLHSVCFSPDGERLAIGSNGNEAIKLWDVRTLQELVTLQGEGSMFQDV
ncbi:MAG: hypothetical protein RI897_856, partial [Verrucomicrobiota bacterium]